MSETAKVGRQKSALGRPRPTDFMNHQQQQQGKPETETETRSQLQQSSTERRASSARCPGCTNEYRNQQQPLQPGRRRRSSNKIYHTPPTPEPELLHVKERSFVLDSVAVNTAINDHTARPKLGKVRYINYRLTSQPNVIFSCFSRSAAT